MVFLCKILIISRKKEGGTCLPFFVFFGYRYRKILIYLGVYVYYAFSGSFPESHNCGEG